MPCQLPLRPQNHPNCYRAMRPLMAFLMLLMYFRDILQLARGHFSVCMNAMHFPYPCTPGNYIICKYVPDFYCPGVMYMSGDGVVRSECNEHK